MFPLPNYPTLRLFLDGMLLMMSLYALATYGWHRKRIYAYYGLYISGMIANLHFNDQAHILLDQHAPDRAVALATWLEFSIQSVAFVFYIRFATTLLDMRQFDPVSLRLSNYMMGVLVMGQLVDTLYFWLEPLHQFDHWRGVLTDLNRYAMAALTFMIVPRILRLRNTVSSIFIVGTTFFVGGSVLAVTMNLVGWGDRLPEQPFSFPLIPMQLGIVIETLLFTMAISLLNRQTELKKIQYQSQLIEQLQENERKQARLNSLRDEIARDLHDEMGSQLSSISIMSQTTARLVADEHARHRLAIIGETARQVMASMREIVWSLNSTSDSLQQVGLRISETAHCLFGDGAVQLHADLTDTNTAFILTEKQRRELHLIAKECLTNIVRHANAQNVWLILRTQPNGLILTIRDDGIGFNPDRDTSGLGLRSIRQRAEALRATLQIDAEPGDGTSIRIDCPTLIRSGQVTAVSLSIEPLLASA